MKQILIISIVALAMVLGQAQSPKDTQQNQVVQAVLQTEREIDEALLKGEVAKVEKLVSDDFTLTPPSGTMGRKKQWLAAIQEGRLKYISLQREGQEVRLYEETAVVTGIINIKRQRDTQNIESKNRYLRVYVNRQGRWQLAAHQATKIEQK